MWVVSVYLCTIAWGHTSNSYLCCFCLQCSHHDITFFFLLLQLILQFRFCSMFRSKWLIVWTISVEITTCIVVPVNGWSKRTYFFRFRMIYDGEIHSPQFVLVIMNTIHNCERETYTFKKFHKCQGRAEPSILWNPVSVNTLRNVISSKIGPRFISFCYRLPKMGVQRHKK